jgi:hypothetical protein
MKCYTDAELVSLQNEAHDTGEARAIAHTIQALLDRADWLGYRVDLTRRSLTPLAMRHTNLSVEVTKKFVRAHET